MMDRDRESRPWTTEKNRKLESPKARTQVTKYIKIKVPFQNRQLHRQTLKLIS